MPEGKGYAGGFGPSAEFPMQNSEGMAVAEGQETETGVPATDAGITSLRDAGINAKKTNPFGPCWPGLAEYFRGEM